MCISTPLCLDFYPAFCHFTVLKTEPRPLCVVFPLLDCIFNSLIRCSDLFSSQVLGVTLAGQVFFVRERLPTAAIRAPMTRPLTDRNRTRRSQAGLLQMNFRALALGCEAGDGPHLYLDACVKLLVSHVPHTLDRGGNCLVL